MLDAGIRSQLREALAAKGADSDVAWEGRRALDAAMEALSAPR
jgi:hypothetical protein